MVVIMVRLVVEEKRLFEYKIKSSTGERTSSSIRETVVMSYGMYLIT